MDKIEQKKRSRKFRKHLRYNGEIKPIIRKEEIKVVLKPTIEEIKIARASVIKNDPLPKELTHVNPNCKNTKCCEPHGETGPINVTALPLGSTWRADPNFDLLAKIQNQTAWTRTITISIIIGIALGFFLATFL